MMLKMTKKKGTERRQNNWAKVAELWWWGWLFRQKKECWLKWASLYSLFFTGTPFSAHRKAFAFHSNTTASKSLWKLWHFNKRRSGQPGGKRGNCDQMFETGLIAWETPVCSGGKLAVGIDVYSCQICIHYMGVMDTLERNNTVKAEAEVRICNPLKAFHSVFLLFLRCSVRSGISNLWCTDFLMLKEGKEELQKENKRESFIMFQFLVPFHEEIFCKRSISFLKLYQQTIIFIELN